MAETMTMAYLQEGSATELLAGKTGYGESQLNPEVNNLRGKRYQAFDGAGVVTTDDYDFKGNLLSSRRQLAVDYKITPDWSAAVALEVEVFTTRTSFDALNRPVSQTTPDNSTIRRTYNGANLLEAVDANLRGETAVGELVWKPFVTDIDYSAKGQRERIAYGNGVATTSDYDPLTFRLIRLQTQRGSAPLQDLSYTYDPAGNITHIEDDAQQTIYFRNKRVEPSNDYLYDATYRLIEATGREHLGQLNGRPNAPTAPDGFNRFHTGLEHPGDGNAMGQYLERYVYDAVGNFREMQHVGSDPAHPGWTRAYDYEEDSLIEAGKKSNRLTRTTVGNGLNHIEPYTHDAHGSMTSMLHLPLMQWNYRDQLEASAQQVVNSGSPETTYYVYDGGGQRVRKVTERAAGPGKTPTRLKERIYLGGFEIYREYDADGSTVSLERETLHLMDDQQRVALVEMRTQGDAGSPAQLIRYHFGDHLGSASLELGVAGDVISYEEYYPYGSTSYQAVDASIKAAAKRYRYTGMERDDESGLAYHGARYYAGWLGRWTSADPVQSLHAYSYAANNPAVLIDSDGRVPVAPFVIGGLMVVGGVMVSNTAHGPTSEAQAAAAEPEGLVQGNARIAGGMVTGYAIGGMLVAGSAGAAAAYQLGPRQILSNAAARVAGPGALLQSARGTASTLLQLGREQGLEFLGAGILNRIHPGLGDLVFSVGLPVSPATARTASKLTSEGSALSNISESESAKDVLQNFGEGTGFTGVYDPDSDVFILLPSGRPGNEPTLRLSGGLDDGDVVDEGLMVLDEYDEYLPQSRGHKGVLTEMAEQTGITGPKGLAGFAIVNTPEGEALQFRWSSGVINFPNYGTRELPEALRQQIADAVSTATGRPLPTDLTP